MTAAGQLVETDRGWKRALGPHRGITSFVAEFARTPDLPGVLPFQLTQDFLNGHNDESIAELWNDAGLGSIANTTRAYLVSILLEDVPKLAAARFVSRMFRGES
ncbi:hypothetical protein [Deinococcus sp. QL22]|uniref:hypothetical protein n=1 Tax=Deinococcus sp. QL22 TaxID=2939437 RepID=UPI00201767A7|nr:hypothetical protein [Deinococcus sp. QL22]UQN08258.1 hypothetical protein M1R55_16075 [Deinococcus sp. QL22]